MGGTTRYMAPELFRKRPADQRSEVFSLGVTIYRLFSGGPFPFGRRETVPLQRLRPDLPTWPGQCLMSAIKKIEKSVLGTPESLPTRWKMD